MAQVKLNPINSSVDANLFSQAQAAAADISDSVSAIALMSFKAETKCQSVQIVARPKAKPAQDAGILIKVPGTILFFNLSRKRRIKWQIASRIPPTHGL